MKVKDKREEGKTREGAGRVAIHKACGGLIYSYTLECNYVKGSKINPISQRFNSETGLNMPDDDNETSIDSFRYKNGPPIFASEVLWDIGRAVCISLLDLTNQNNYSRLINTPYKNALGVQ